MNRFGIALCGFAATLAFGAISPAASGQEAPSKPAFYKDVLPILQENCQVCHRPNGANLGGMVAPMAFTDYEATRPWAKSIAQQVSNRTMPPWHASAAQKDVFLNERSLDQWEIDTLVRWVETGASRGNSKDAPEPVAWPSSEGWTIGEPDLIVKMEKPFFVEDDVTDLYERFRTEISEEMLPEDRWVQAVEFRPGSSVVHHIIAPPLGGIAPGNQPTIYREGLGRKLTKGSSVSWQMHYHKEPGPGTGVWDQSMAAIKFYPKDAEITEIIGSDPLGRFDFAIPPGESDYTMSTKYTFGADAKLLQLMPHMHLRGKSAKYEVTYPDGTHEVLLDVPQYDFNWQTAYEFKDLKTVPKGTEITFTSVWDNSDANPFNPDSAQTVTWGQPTTDEMSFGFMQFVYENPEDAPDGSGSMFGFGGGGRRGEGGRRGGPSFDLKEMSVRLDANKDGMLQKNELPGPFQRMFDRMDQNGDGSIDTEEMEAVQKMMQGRGRGRGQRGGQ